MKINKGLTLMLIAGIFIIIFWLLGTPAFIWYLVIGFSLTRLDSYWGEKQ